MGDQARWLLNLLRPGVSSLAADAAERRFSSRFLTEVPVGEIEALIEQVRSAGPFTVVAVTPVTSERGLNTVRVRLSGQDALVMEVAVDDKGKIAGLFFRPDPDATPVPQYDSFDDMSEDLAAVGTAQVFVGEMVDGGCQARYESPSGAAAAPSGSIFKLVVLSAVIDAVAAGELAWQDELLLTKQSKSLPSGRLQDRDDGSRVTVRKAARLMISISDNTAADLLLDAMRDDRVRDTVEDLGLRDASLRPLLSTRQFFLLGWGRPDLARRWSDSNPEQRARLLDRLPEDLGVVDPAAVTTPVWPRGVGWFFTGEEICRMHARLQVQARGSGGGPAREILAENPGVPVPAGIDYLAFKGGSAPGVVALSYLAEPASGPAQVLVVQVRDESVLSAAEVVVAARGGLALLP